MANQNRKNSTNPGKLKPLPKPVRPGQTAPPPRRAVPIDPDEFDLPRKVPRQTQQKPSEPSLIDALQIYIRRTFRFKKRRQPHGNQQDKRIKKLAGLSALCVVCIMLIVSIIWSATNKNAYAVSLGGEPIGYIARAQDIDETALQAQAVSRLEAALDARVQVNEQLTVTLVHTSNKNILPDTDVIDQVSRAFTYKIAATAIYVEGKEIAVLRKLEDAEAVEQRLQQPYINGDFEDYVSVTFVEDWQLITKMVDQEELNTAEDALIQLDKKTRAMEDYIIQSGDALDKIARKNNTTVEKICADNPGYTTSTILRVGNVIQLETTKPYLSVKTVEENVRKETIPMPIKNVDNPNEYKTYTKVIQEGSDGEREVTVRITRINGIQIGPEDEIATRNIIEPIERIVEVGTSETTPQRR